jgi:hypothetical protein
VGRQLIDVKEQKATKTEEVQYVLEYGGWPRSILDLGPIRNLPLILQSKLQTKVNRELNKNKEDIQSPIKVELGSQIAVITLQEGTM